MGERKEIWQRKIKGINFEVLRLLWKIWDGTVNVWGREAMLCKSRMFCCYAGDFKLDC